MNRSDLRRFFDFFGGEIEVTHSTFSTEVSLPGEIDLYQIQFDTVSSEQTDTSILVTVDGADLKRRALTGIGTAEVTFLGRRVRVPASSQCYLTRPDGDFHTIFFSMVYRPVDQGPAI